MSYQKPTLVEIYAELHLDSGSFTPEAFFDVVPRLRSSGFSEVELGQVGNLTINAEEQKQMEFAPRVRCWNRGKTELIQFSPDFIAANLVGPYPGWSRFRQVLRAGVESLTAAVANPRYISAALCTIDKIRVRQEEFALGRFLQCGGKFLPVSYESVSQAFDITLGRGFLQADGFNRQISVRGRPQGEHFEIRIDAKFHDQIRSDKDDPLKVFEDLHEESNATFEALVTDTTRNELMGGTVSHAANV